VRYTLFYGGRRRKGHRGSGAKKVSKEWGKKSLGGGGLEGDEKKKSSSKGMSGSSRIWSEIVPEKYRDLRSVTTPEKIGIEGREVNSSSAISLTHRRETVDEGSLGFGMGGNLIEGLLDRGQPGGGG